MTTENNTTLETLLQTRGIPVDAAKEFIKSLETDPVDFTIADSPSGEPVIIVGESIEDEVLGTHSGMAIPMTEKIIHGFQEAKFVPKEARDDNFIEIAPGIGISKSAIREATKGASETEERKFDLNEKREQAEKKRKSKSYEELLKDLKISEKVVDSLVKQRKIQQLNREAAEVLLQQSIERQKDRRIQFVDVTDASPVGAVSRVLHLKEINPEQEVEPIDLKDVYKDVEVQQENQVVDQVSRIFHTRTVQTTEKLPDKIVFAVPNVDILNSSEPSSDVTYDLHNYVNIKALPPELQSVVGMVLALRVGYENTYELDEKDSFQRFVDAIDTLKARATEARDKVELEKIEGSYTNWCRLAGL